MWKVTIIAREENQWADALSKLASSALSSKKEPIYVEEWVTPAIASLNKIEIHDLVNWRQPILEYIINNKFSENKHETRSLSYKVRNYCIVNDKLYR